MVRRGSSILVIGIGFFGLLLSGCGGCGPLGGPTMNVGEECCFEQIASGSANSCAIDDGGQISCWGFEGSGVTDVPSGNFDDIALQSMQACAIDDGGEIDCWGETEGSPPEGTFTALTVGCAIDADGAIECRDDTDESTLPEGEFTAISGGCAIETDGSLQCWGDGDGPPDLDDVQDVDGSAASGCAIDGSGTIECWGENYYGLSNPPDGSYSDLSISIYHACAVSDSRDIDCWGMEDIDDEPVDVEFEQHLPDEHLDSEASFSAVSAGQNHTCALDTDGYIHCWGDNSEGAVSPP